MPVVTDIATSPLHEARLKRDGSVGRAVDVRINRRLRVRWRMPAAAIWTRDTCGSPIVLLAS
jgi:hypothetical protein